MSLQDLLAQHELRLAVHVSVALDAPVRWVATSELPDPTPFLEGGELLLTTGLETSGWEDEWDEYVARLVRRGVVGLGLATGLTYAAPPAALVAACQRHRLDLLEVPHETTFVAVSRTAARLLEEREAAAQRESLAVQRDLTQAALRRDDPSGVLRRLASAVGGSVGVVGVSGQHLDGPHGESSLALDAESLRTEIARLRPQGLRASSAVVQDEGTHLVMPLGLRHQPAAYLLVSSRGRLTTGQRAAVTTAVALLSLALEGREEQRGTLRRLRGRAVELVVRGDPSTAAVVVGALTPDAVSLPGRVQVIRAAGNPGQVEDALRDLEDTAASPSAHLVAPVGDGLRAVAAPEPSAALAASLADSGLLVGVGTAVTLAQAARSDTAAVQALAHASEHNAVVRWEQVARSGVTALLERSTADAFAETFLAPLHESDDTGGLRETLGAFLRHHGSRGAVSAELGIHRNTVRHRIRQIERMLGSLDDPQVRANAWIALQLDAERALRDAT